MPNSLSPIYYISLASSTARRGSIERQLAAQGLENARWIAAFDGRKLNPAKCGDHDPAAMLRYIGRPMTGGEYGCYKSHIEALEAGLASGAEAFVVLEDDAMLSEDFGDKLDELRERMVRLDPDWQVVHLAPLKVKFATRVDELSSGAEVFAAHYFPMTTTALFWSQSGARNFLQVSRMLTRPVDNQMRDYFSRRGGGYAVHPAIVKPASGVSDIDAATENRSDIRRTWHYGYAKQRRLSLAKGNAIYNLLRFRWLRARRST